MRKNPARYFLWLFILVGLSCRTHTSGPSGESVIFGVIRDSLGSPVSSAYLNFVFRFRSIITNQVYADTPTGAGVTAVIRFEIPSRAFINFSIENYIGNPIRTLVSDTLQPGTYVIQWDGKDEQQRDAYTDCYYLKRTVNSYPLEKSKMVLVTAQHLSSNPAPYVQTDNNGRFTIPLSRLPVNEIFIRTINDPTPVDSVKLDDIQTLFAFKGNSYGSSTISLADRREVIITLNTTRGDTIIVP
jgi:hypothetical protein